METFVINKGKLFQNFDIGGGNAFVRVRFQFPN